MKRSVQNHLNQAAFVAGAAASGFVASGLRAAVKTRERVLERPDKKKTVVLGETKYRPAVTDPTELLTGIRSDLDEIKDALVDIAKQK
ncbi:hypothetical protein LFYK43_12650 [Ligilactobacillus salitolerans]|uniref:Uncharacterized protein n=1 Tax=Ligilactobacillus salitolerans TaxID=1808352 RepID=A0A401ITF8_9LACO|nr:hypothetical protein [Ligilactobacillus salitolerans]GBG94806.1 hypothetical protein LFYK43_12650 [Ligilactobacillus salitolerans]